MIPQHQLLGIRIQIHLLAEPIEDPISAVVSPYC